MKENSHIGDYQFRVEPFSEDVTGQISWGHLGNVLLRCAQFHAEGCGFGFGPMSRERLSWVFSRLILDFPDGRPRTGDDYVVSTWASTIFRQFTTRLYEMRRPDGTPWGHVYSVWALINLQTRQPVDLMALPTGSFSDILEPVPVDFPITGPGRIRVRAAVPVAEREVCFTDLDVNGHLNSIRAMEWVLDLFPPGRFQGNGLRRVEMAYAQETFGGERLQFFVDEREDGICDVELRKAGSGTVAVRAQLVF